MKIQPAISLLLYFPSFSHVWEGPKPESPTSLILLATFSTSDYTRNLCLYTLQLQENLGPRSQFAILLMQPNTGQKKPASMWGPPRVSEEERTPSRPLHSSIATTGIDVLISIGYWQKWAWTGSYYCLSGFPRYSTEAQHFSNHLQFKCNLWVPPPEAKQILMTFNQRKLSPGLDTSSEHRATFLMPPLLQDTGLQLKKVLRIHRSLISYNLLNGINLLQHTPVCHTCTSDLMCSRYTKYDTAGKFAWHSWCFFGQVLSQ